MKKVKLITIILTIALVTMVAFFGVYVKVQNRMEDKVKDYSYAMDLKGARNVKLKVDTSSKTIIKDSEGNEVDNSENLTDEQITEKGYTKEEILNNSEEILNLENYRKSKDVIEERLKKLKVDNYIIKLDEQTGDIIIELTENDNTDAIISNLGTTGKFEIIDSQTKEVLMDNNDIKLAKVMYGSNNQTTTSSGTSVYLNIEFTKEGTKKLEDISNKYVKVEESTDNAKDTQSESETENDASENKITMQIDDEEIMSTSFEEPIRTGSLQLSVGTASTDNKTIQEYVNRASNMATVLDTGKTPIKYDVDNNEYVLSDITDNELKIIAYIGFAIIILALIVLAIRYKPSGILGAISFIGLVSIFALVIRYANVIISIEGIFGIALVLILNYIFINKLLLKLKEKSKELDKEIVKKSVKETYKEFFIKIIPICVTVVIFCFIKWVPISSFGMIMFWGITLIAIYNFIVTNSLLKIKAGK